MKKLTTLLLAVIVFASTYVTAFATEQTRDLSTYTPDEIVAMYSDACEAMREGVENFETQISIAGYGVTKDNMSLIFECFTIEYPELFYLNPTTYGYSVSYGTSNIVAFRPKYLYKEEESAEKIQELNEAVKYFLSGVDEAWTDFEKCLYLHDKIVYCCKYDNDLSNSFNADAYTIYGALVNNESVCRGYAVAYNYLLGKVGIEAHYMTSDAINHGWSLVKLDGNYYHVDATWDDPLYDLVGRVWHKYFFLSDSKLLELRPEGVWNSNSFQATDTSYDDAWFREVDNAIYPVDGKLYYLDNEYRNSSKFGAVKYYDKETDTHTTVHELNGTWYANSTHTSFWVGCFSGFAYDGELLYFNTSDKVYTMTPSGENWTEYFEKPADLTAVDINGVTIDSHDRIYIEYRECTGPTNNDGAIYAIDGKENEYAMGDINNDGKVSIRDVTTLQLFLAKTITLSVRKTSLSDYNTDGVITIGDVTELQKKLCYLI